VSMIINSSELRAGGFKLKSGRSLTTLVPNVGEEMLGFRLKRNVGFQGVVFRVRGFFFLDAVYFLFFGSLIRSPLTLKTYPKNKSVTRKALCLCFLGRLGRT
jgi:hypothetical protein